VRSRNIDFNASEFNVGHILNYSCPKGYSNSGDSQDICLPSETWSSLKGAVCEGKDIFDSISSFFWRLYTGLIKKNYRF